MSRTGNLLPPLGLVIVFVGVVVVVVVVAVVIVKITCHEGIYPFTISELEGVIPP